MYGRHFDEHDELYSRVRLGLSFSLSLSAFGFVFLIVQCVGFFGVRSQEKVWTP